MLGKVQACSAWSPAGSAVSVFASSNFYAEMDETGWDSWVERKLTCQANQNLVTKLAHAVSRSAQESHSVWFRSFPFFSFWLFSTLSK